MAVDLTVLSDAGLDIATGQSYTGGVDKFISAVQRFYKNYEKNHTKAEEYYAAGDLDSYMITVHALKSNALMIGAVNLSEGFEGLEHAARDRKKSYIEENHAAVMAEYSQLIDNLKAVGETEQILAAGEISSEEARKTADELLAALDDFDDEKSKELAVKLSGYPFRITQSSRLKEAIALIEDFMYDDAADIVKELIPNIE